MLHSVAGIAYLLSSLGYFFELIFSEKRMERVALWLLMVAMACHSILLAIHISEESYPFILGEGDFLFFTSWILVLTFLVLRRKYHLARSGVFFVPLILLLFILAEVIRGEYQFGEPALNNRWALSHIVFMSLAFAIFTVSFLVGILYLLQRHQLKSRKPTLLLTWLPSLESMDEIHYKALSVGFILLSVGMIAGAALSKTTVGYFFSGDPRQIASLLTWVLYAVILNIRTNAGWRGRRGILLSLLGFIGIVLTYLGLAHR